MKFEEKVAKILIEKGLTVSTAESCTGGLLSSKLTDISGSTAYTKLNLVTYTIQAKRKMLGVSINEEDVVSEDCSFQMAKGLHELTGADICLSTTGNAGPTGEPVGLMYSTIYTREKSQSYKILLDSSIPRVKMKEKFAEEVLKNLFEFLEK
ncbi:MAG: CinA family protein [Candidatus Gastranaerophilales bacterium]|nr:CinA family protein [Candidatus Gastranaerophilales bacterium]MCM1072392.1 CinA family protein [Bacteroides sp.]